MAKAKGGVSRVGATPSAVVGVAAQPGGRAGDLHEAEHPEGVPRGGRQPRVWDVVLPGVVLRDPAQVRVGPCVVEQAIHRLERPEVQVRIDPCSNAGTKRSLCRPLLPSPEPATTQLFHRTSAGWLCGGRNMPCMYESGSPSLSKWRPWYSARELTSILVHVHIPC